MNALENIYYGKELPFEKGFSKSPEYRKLMEALLESSNGLTALVKTLPNSRENQELLNRVFEDQIRVSGFMERERFIDGFRMGAAVIIESLLRPA